MSSAVDYDSRSLSPHDLEVLCRDLLKRQPGVWLESFMTGSDPGINFSCSLRAGNTSWQSIWMR